LIVYFEIRVRCDSPIAQPKTKKMDFTAPFIVEENESPDKELCGKTNQTYFLDHCDKVAICGCEECSELFCSGCMEHHLSSKKFKTHTKTEISTKTPKCLNHPTEPSKFFCFEDKCCLCSTCALLNHKDHDILDIKEATQKLQQEMENFSAEEKIKSIEESIEKINVDISKRDQKYELDSKKLKEDYIMDLDTLDNSKLKLKENFNTLMNFKENKKSSNILLLLQLKDEFDIVSEEIIKEIYSFGWNNCGQLGSGNTTDQTTPQLISTLKNKKIKNVVCGNHYSIIITGKLISLKKQRMVSIHLDTMVMDN
jgi:hypothetical protein